MGIGKRTFQSAGQISQHLIPGAYSRIDSVKGVSGIVSANNTALMGACTGGKPATLLQFNNVAEAVETLRSGPLMDALRLAFNPGNDFIPQRLFAMRVNTAVQSSYNLVDGSSNNMVKIESKDYGAWTNQIQIKVEAGTVGKKLSVKYGSSEEIFDNVYRGSFTIQYTGSGTTAEMVITNNSGTQTLVVTVVGNGEDLNLDLNTYNTIEVLAAAINANSGYTCSPVAGQESASSLELDAVPVAQDVKTAVYTAQSTMQAIIDKYNNESGLVVASAVNAANDRVIPELVAAYTFLTGGTEGAYTADEWTAALLVLEAEDIQFVSTPDTSADVLAPIKTHCESMSAVAGKRERQFAVGGLGTEAVSALISAAQTLNSKYGMYLATKDRFTQFDVNGVLTTYATSYAACMEVGMKAAAAINEPLTFKTLNMIALGSKFRESELEQLIEFGVAPINYNTNNIPHLVRQVNTYQTDDLKWNEFSMVVEMLFASRDLRSYLESTFTGKPYISNMGGVVKGAVISKLEQYVDLGVFVREPATGIAYWNIVITVSGDKVTIDYDAYVTAPINFQFVTNHFHELVATI